MAQNFVKANIHDMTTIMGIHKDIYFYGLFELTSLEKILNDSSINVSLNNPSLNINKEVQKV